MPTNVDTGVPRSSKVFRKIFFAIIDIQSALFVVLGICLIVWALAHGNRHVKIHNRFVFGGIILTVCFVFVF